MESVIKIMLLSASFCHFCAALLIFARKSRDTELGYPIPIDVPNAAKVRDVAERIRCYLAVTGLSAESVVISYGDQILDPSSSLADTSIGSESEVHYHLNAVTVKVRAFILRSGCYLRPGDSSCNATINVSPGEPDFLGEVERQFKKWMFVNLENTGRFIGAAVTFKIYFGPINATNSDPVVPGLCSKRNFLIPLEDLSKHHSYAINRDMKAQLVNTAVISMDDPVIGNRMIAQSFEQLKERKVMRLKPELVDFPPKICQFIAAGPVAVSQISPSLLCSEQGSGIDVYKHWGSGTHPEIVIYLQMPFQYDLVLL